MLEVAFLDEHVENTAEHADGADPFVSKFDNGYKLIVVVNEIILSSIYPEGDRKRLNDWVHSSAPRSNTSKNILSRRECTSCKLEVKL